MGGGQVCVWVCVQAGGVVQVVWGRGWQVKGEVCVGVGGRGEGRGVGGGRGGACQLGLRGQGGQSVPKSS